MTPERTESWQRYLESQRLIKCWHRSQQFHVLPLKQTIPLQTCFAADHTKVKPIATSLPSTVEGRKHTQVPLGGAHC